jgi:hypothetical protein
MFAPMTRTIGRILVLAGVAVCAAASVFACSQEHGSTAGAPACKADCGKPPTGGGAGSPDAGIDAAGPTDAGNDAAVMVNVVATVVELGEPTFTTTNNYSGAATISADKYGGGVSTAAYGGTNGTIVTLYDVATGSSWFFVHDDTNGQAGVMSTYSITDLPVNGTLPLPVVSRPVLTAVLSKLPVPAVLDDAAGQIILRFLRNGLPLAGVQLATPITKGVVAFDSGPGLYTTDTQITSTGGTVLVLNKAITGGGGQLALTIVDTSVSVDGGHASYPLSIPLTAGAATYAQVTLPSP